MLFIIAALFYLPMEPMSATSGAVFAELQPLWVILSVLSSSICPLLTLGTSKMNNDSSFSFSGHIYSMMRLMVPAPTVLPPSRIAKRKPFSRATG